MAGVGIQLRKMLARESYVGQLGAYGYAGLVTSGPWVFSVAGVLAIGLLAARTVAPPERVTQFLISVTYLMAASVLLTGPLQLMLSRFVADRVYEGRPGRIVPNFLGALGLTTCVSGAAASAFVFPAFQESLACRVLLVANFVVLCDAWVLTVLLSGIKAHRAVVGLYLGAYLASVGAAVVLRPWGLEGLLAAFLLGQAGALFAALYLVLRAFPARRRVRFTFLDPTRARYDLAAVGAVFFAGAWVDKVIFWFDPATSAEVLGPLRFSIIYDLPIFLAYLTVIPAMAVLFLRLEADFADRCLGFFGAVRDGLPLYRLIQLKDGLVDCVWRGFLAILKVQAITLAVAFTLAPSVLRVLRMSPFYLRLLEVDVVGVALQVLFLAALNYLFFLDERRAALAVCSVFASANAGLTLLTHRLGPDWYGLGFAGAAFLAAACGLVVLVRKLKRLERETFMLQPLWAARVRDEHAADVAGSSGTTGGAGVAGVQTRGGQS